MKKIDTQSPTPSPLPPRAVQEMPPTQTADPHPSDEEDPYDERKPGRAKPFEPDIGPNDAVHGGTAEQSPDNASTTADRHQQEEQ